MHLFFVKVLESLHIMFIFFVCALFYMINKRKSKTVVKPPHLALLLKKNLNLVFKSKTKYFSIKKKKTFFHLRTIFHMYYCT